ncbi:MAG: hypothetical protein HYR88_06985 [Verrucomicrobia bacterium]|nr:hypothetical protein [Verrucomicrobiota bacterium]MBI3870619.1 hypothetical protein [Verrucomicrobiota bacterium]
MRDLVSTEAEGSVRKPGGRRLKVDVAWGRALTGLTIASFVCCRVEAQEALKFSLAGESAARLRRLALEQSTATTHWGNLQVSLHGRLFNELNDNITLVPERPLSDLILRAQAGIEARLPVSTRNQLEFSLSGGYAKYVQHPEFDRPYLLPGSRVGFDLFLTPFRITFEDSFSYQQDPAERAVVTGTAKFGGLQNLAGLTILHDANRIKTSVGYHHLLFLSSTADFRHLDRGSHLIVGRVDGEVYPTLNAGVETGITPTGYRHSFLRDNLSISGGAFVRWTASRHSSLEARVGMVAFHYASIPGQPRSSDVTSTYFSIDTRHRLRKHIELHIPTGRESTLGVNNDQLDLWYARPELDWTYRARGSLQVGLQYERGQEQGTRKGEKFDRWGISCGSSWGVAKHVSAGLHYAFMARSSEAASRAYANHRLTFDLGF